MWWGTQNGGEGVFLENLVCVGVTIAGGVGSM